MMEFAAKLSISGNHKAHPMWSMINYDTVRVLFYYEVLVEHQVLNV